MTLKVIRLSVSTCEPSLFTPLLITELNLQILRIVATEDVLLAAASSDVPVFLVLFASFTRSPARVTMKFTVR